MRKYTPEIIKDTNFGFKKGIKYLITKGDGRITDKTFKGFYYGQSGENLDFIIFEHEKGYKECFLKVDILIGLYKIKEINKQKKKNYDWEDEWEIEA